MMMMMIFPLLTLELSSALLGVEIYQLKLDMYVHTTYL